jgi:hypothetical protein
MTPLVDPYHLTLILVALITGVISPVLVQITRYLISKSNKKDQKCDIVRNIEIEDTINTKLEEIRKKFSADRVWIGEFHNGGHTFTGKSMQKFSETYEAVQKGISQEARNTQNLPTSLFSPFLKTVTEEGIFIFNKGNDAVSNSLKGFFESRGVTSFISVVIKNLNENSIGILCIEKVGSDFVVNDKQVEKLKLDAYNVAGYLEMFLIKR